MTILETRVIWDDGINRLSFIPEEESFQYNYIKDIPCICFDVSYENPRFKACDRISLFDKGYTGFHRECQSAKRSLTGKFQMTDSGADTDAYIDFTVSPRGVDITGRLGASFSDFSLSFSFQADQSILQLIENCLSIH